MNDKIVTHEDLPALDLLTSLLAPVTDDQNLVRAAADLLVRAYAAAEADKPALPEGWVLCWDEGAPRVFHHDGTGGLWYGPGNTNLFTLDNFTPITPLATALSLAPQGWRVDEDGEGCPTIWDYENELAPFCLLRRASNPPIFDVLAALITAAQAERGQS